MNCLKTTLNDAHFDYNIKPGLIRTQNEKNKPNFHIFNVGKQNSTTNLNLLNLWSNKTKFNVCFVYLMDHCLVLNKKV